MKLFRDEQGIRNIGVSIDKDKDGKPQELYIEYEYGGIALHIDDAEEFAYYILDLLDNRVG